MEPEEFCRDFGQPVNKNTGKDLDLEELQEDIISGEGFETVCFDSTPSLARFKIKDPVEIKKRVVTEKKHKEKKKKDKTERKERKKKKK